jgi:hypothetical protein
MNQILVNPWLALGTLASVVIIACTLIVFVTEYLRKTQQASIDAYLKQEMISRGMSAADIKTVLESSSDAEAARLSNCANQGVQVGLAKFHIKVGELRKTASELEDSVALKN